MKEIQPQTKDKVVIVGEQEKKFQQVFLGSYKPYKGHKLWKVCKKTLEITEAEYEKLDLHIKDLDKPLIGAKKKKVIIEEGFLYIQALNKKNVLKKLMKK